MAFVDVRQPVTGKLLFRFDAERDIIEIQERGVKTVVDLSTYRAPKSAKENASERQEDVIDNGGDSAGYSGCRNI